jgi:hypothetical protein
MALARQMSESRWCSPKNPGPRAGPPGMPTSGMDERVPSRLRFLQCRSRSLALSDISLQCNDLSLSRQSGLSRLAYPLGEFMTSRPSNTARRKFAGRAPPRQTRSLHIVLMRFRIPSAAPPLAFSERADTLGFGRRHASGDSDAVPALARSETLPRLSIFALLLLLGQARVVVGHTLSLRLLRRGSPLVVVRPVGAVMGWHEGFGERRCH